MVAHTRVLVYFDFARDIELILEDVIVRRVEKVTNNLVIAVASTGIYRIERALQ